MKKTFAVFLVILIDLGQFAREVLFPFNLVMSLLDPFVSDDMWDLLTVISWVLTMFYLTIIILGWVYDIDDEEEEYRFERKLKKVSK